PTAALDLPLAQASDVLVVARFPSNDLAAVSFDAPACGRADLRACATSYAPVRAGLALRNVAAGDWRVVVADSLAQQVNVIALVRPTAAPTVLSGGPGSAGDTCANAVDVPPEGGFFEGDTTSAAADFGVGCDVAGSGGNGAPDRVLRLVLTQ